MENISKILEDTEKYLTENYYYTDFENKKKFKNFIKQKITELLMDMPLEERTFPDLESDDFDEGYSLAIKEIKTFRDNLLK